MGTSRPKARAATRRTAQTRGDAATADACAGAEAWRWHHAIGGGERDAVPGKRRKGAPYRRDAGAEQDRLRQRADAYRSALATSRERQHLAPHLEELISRPPNQKDFLAGSQPDTFIQHLLSIAPARPRSLAALYVPIVIFAALLFADGAMRDRVRTGFVGEAVAALDKRLMEPSALVVARGIARDDGIARSIMVDLPAAVVVSLPLDLKPMPPIALPDVRLAALAPSIDQPVPPSPLEAAIKLPEIVLRPAAPEVVLPEIIAKQAPDAVPALEAPSVPRVAAAPEQCVRPAADNARDAARTAALSMLDAVDRDDPLVFGRALAAAAIAQTRELSVYNAKYVRIAYPMGDVTTQFGVCSDVIVRAYRALDIDLQELVHLSRAGAADSNIDHRRTEMLRAFFATHGTSFVPSQDAEDFLPGDIVTYYRPQNTSSTAHIAIVTGEIAPSGRPMIVHNRGWGVQLEDALFVDQMTGHYRFRGLSPAMIAQLPKSSRIALQTEKLRARIAEARAQRLAMTKPEPGGRGTPERSGVTARVTRSVAVEGQGPNAGRLPTPMGLGVRATDNLR